MCNNNDYYDRKNDCPNKQFDRDNWPKSTSTRHYFRAGEYGEICDICGQPEDNGRHFKIPASLRKQAS